MKSFRWLTKVNLILVLALVAALALAGFPNLEGKASTTITVTTTADTVNNDGYCSLREAIIAANTDKSSGRLVGECAAGSGADTIIVPAGTYTLSRTNTGNEDTPTTGDLDISSDVTIVGAGAKTTIINTTSGFSDRIFQMLSGTITISGLTISGGNSTANGGGILNSGTVTLQNDVVTGNNSTAQGGGLYNSSGATLTVNSSTLAGNNAGSQGGGLFNAGTLTLFDSTVSGNTSSTDGGGLYNNSNASLNSVTLAGNLAGQSGQGAGGGINVASGTVNLDNTILSGNHTGSASGPASDCFGSLASPKYSLILATTGCTLAGTPTANITGHDPLLGPLASNGGPTPTLALGPGSPAIDAGDNANCPAVDQRGLPRPRALGCDIGAFEVQDPIQAGPLFTVNTAADHDDGACTFYDCTLREAINAANNHPNGSSPDKIVFAPQSSPYVIKPTTSLPQISDPVIIDGTTGPGGTVTIDGSQAGGSDGLTVTGGGSTLTGLTVTGFSHNGIVLANQGGNHIRADVITNNGASGVVVVSGTGDSIQGSRLYGNGALAIDLGGDGITANHLGGPASGPNNLQNHPVLARVVPSSSNLDVEGYLNSAPNTTYTVEVFSNPLCSQNQVSQAQNLLAAFPVSTDAGGNVYFQQNLPVSVPTGQFITTTATDPGGNTSEVSPCVVAGLGNDAWTRALPLSLAPTSPNDLTATFDETIDQLGQSRWFRFTVQPGSQLVVTLTNLPADYSLSVYKDIGAAFDSLNTPNDLNRLGAETPSNTFSPDNLSNDAFSADEAAPYAFTPYAFSPYAFTPYAFTPYAFTPYAFTPYAFTPDALVPDSYNADAFASDTFAPYAFTPYAFTPYAFTPYAFTSAQTRSLIAVSAFKGATSQGVRLNTWNNTGTFYIRVRGSNGAFNLTTPFHLTVQMLTGTCQNVNPVLPPTSLTASGGNYHTIIVTDMARMQGSDADKSALQQNLATLASRPEVAGVVVDVNGDNRVAAAFAQADQYPQCPYAENLVASSIKNIIDEYRAQNPLQYVVLVGSDQTIPFFRYPDQTPLGNEQGYTPPVLDNTPSQASLQLSYILSQDEYGSQTSISFKSDALPLPGLPVGRLVETASDVNTFLSAYLNLSTQSGGVLTPSTGLVTGYDFLANPAVAVASEFQSGLGHAPDTLIEPRNLPPTDPSAWTADQLKAIFLGQRHDITFLAGHFSANAALAADYTTHMTTTDLMNSTVDLQNALIFSAGCHSGYNIVDSADVPGVTLEPDWAQAFARKGAELIGGTGYQYGDTDFIAYSEELYLLFSKQLLVGSGPVSIGNALMAAKQAYLNETPDLEPINVKSYLESTLFGLPMMSINMPQGRGNSSSSTSIISSTTPAASNPGAALGLTSTDVTITPQLSLQTASLSDVTNPGTSVTATYLSGKDGTTTQPYQPTLPLETYNVTVPGTVLRGVGFRGGSYTDLANVYPFTGAAATEIRGVHAPFLTSYFFPSQLASVNYYDALADPTNGITTLVVTPAQYRSMAPGSNQSVLRGFNNLDLRLFYSNNVQTYNGGSVPALSEAPAIPSVTSTVSNGVVTFRIRVTGNPAAGIQAVWVTYTDISNASGGTWQSIDLTQDPNDSTAWVGALNLNGGDPQNIRYFVQAVNGVGLVSMQTNQGAYYIPGQAAGPTQPTSLTLQVPGGPAPFSSQLTLKATLTSNGTPLANEPVNIGLGQLSNQGLTDSNGVATVSISVLASPGNVPVNASFLGDNTYGASTAGGSLNVVKANTAITLNPQPASGYPGVPGLVTATLTDQFGHNLVGKTLVFIVAGSGGTFTESLSTNYIGQASLDALSLLHGTYTVAVYFDGTIPLPNGSSITINDDSYNPSSAATTLTILDRAPVAVTYAYSTNEDQTLTVAAPGLLANDTDPDGDPLTAVLDTPPAHGSLTLNPDGSFTYQPNQDYNGVDMFTYTANDGILNSAPAAVTITVNPVNDLVGCSTATASVPIIWSPDNNLTNENVTGISSTNGGAVSILITSIFQDEPVGTNSQSPDGFGVGTSTAQVRDQRDGNGDGRFYHIFFTASEPSGDTCSGQVTVSLPNNQGGSPIAIDEGPLYDSTVPGN